MNRYVTNNSKAPTNIVITEDAIKAMSWIGFTSETTSEDIVAAGYILLPTIETDPVDNEVLVADKNQAGEWTLTCVSAAEWESAAATKLLGAMIRAQRNKLLADCDWTQSKDIPDNISSAWTTYRQSLRDITLQEGFPNTINWPQKPV